MIKLHLKRDGQHHRIATDTSAAEHLSYLQKTIPKGFRRLQNRIDKVDLSLRMLVSALIARGWLEAHLSKATGSREYVFHIDNALSHDLFTFHFRFSWVIAVDVSQQKLSVYVQHERVQNMEEGEDFLETHHYELTWRTQ